MNPWLRLLRMTTEKRSVSRFHTAPPPPRWRLTSDKMATTSPALMSQMPLGVCLTNQLLSALSGPWGLYDIDFEVAEWGFELSSVPHTSQVFLAAGYLFRQLRGSLTSPLPKRSLLDQSGMVGKSELRRWEVCYSGFSQPREPVTQSEPQCHQKWVHMSH